MPPRRSVADRFWEKVDRRGGSDVCWLWQKGVNADGYGVLKIKGTRVEYAHRLAYLFAKGPIDKGLLLRHLCASRYPAKDIRYRRCCNPSHLEAGTSLENVQDMVSAGRAWHTGKRWGEPKQLTMEGLGLAGLALWMTCFGCVAIRHPPAASTPVREARYLRTNDLGNFALGAGCDLAASGLYRGIGVLIHPVRRADGPLGRVVLCAAGFVVQRSVDKGYRESGAIFGLSGAWVMAMARKIVGRL